MQIDGEYHHQVGCDHGKFALGEVHDVGGAEDQHEAERYQRIDGADADTGKEQLQYEIHENARWERLAALLVDYRYRRGLKSRMERSAQREERRGLTGLSAVGRGRQ